MKITSKIICLFVIPYLFLTNVTGDVKISTKEIDEENTILECQITDKIKSVSCNITILLRYIKIKEALTGCYNNDNIVEVVLSMLSYLKSFECISDDPITIDFDFGDQKPLPKFTKFKTERIVTDFSNSSSYKFKLKMIVPDERRRTLFNTLFVRQADLLKYILPIGILGARDTSKGFTNIKVSEEVVYLPACTYYAYYSLYFLEGFKADETCLDSPSKLNLSSDSSGSMVQRNYREGFFRVNMSSLWNRRGILMCVDRDVESDPSKWEPGKTCLSYGLQFPPSLQFFPPTNVLYHAYWLVESPTRLSTSKTRLICSSAETNVTITYKSEKNVNNIPLNHYEVSKPEHRFVTEIEISNSQLEEGDYIHCANSSNNNNTLHSWRISQLKNPQLIYDSTIEKFFCKSFISHESNMLQIECFDISQCRMWDKYLQYKNGFDVCGEKFTSFMKGHNCDCNYGSSDSSCRCLSPTKRAVLQCSLENNNIIPLMLKELYFRGFDGKTYTQLDVKTEAIVQLKCLKEDGYFIFGQNISCSCEGHSFFHAHGIQWLVIFTNGSIHTISKDIITYKERPTTKDEYNPLSVVDIWFKFRDMKSIICAVPVLNTKEWHNATEHIQSIDGMAPRILSIEADKAFTVGEKGQSLSCVSEGRPTPNVEWSRENGPIEASNVFGQKNFKQLIFSDYNDTLNGEYVCTASNTFGNATKSFKISTKTDTDSVFGITSILILTILICLLTFILLTVYLIHRLRASQRIITHLTESEIDEFFQGNESLQSTQSNPFALPYDMQYEMAKDSFEIDKKQILGSGEFGTVYKGNIHTRGEFAFKTTRNICSSEGLKGMLSELKIMIYVGGHENIIKLVGAYTQEIKTGVLFIATELCSMGSLHSHLRNMKQEISETMDFLRSESYTKCPRWSEEIANGMDYLSLKHVIHSDLAARNILLTEREVVKISDFGLSRRMYNYVDYKKTDKSNPLPWKWMAIESLREMTFSTQSDVWAYGVTIWEIFSLGDVPFPGITWTIEFVEMLDQGLRNLKPKYASNEVYKIMLTCWNKNATDRPDFSSLRYFFMDYKIEDLNGESSDCPNQEDVYMDLNP